MTRSGGEPRVLHFQRRVLNPVVKRLVTAGLYPGVALLETTGRKSGQPRVTPVGNSLDKATGTFWIVAERGYEAAYVKNLQAEPRVRIRIGRRWRAGTAHILPDDDPRERQRSMPKLNAAVVRTFATELLSIRVDLDP